MASFTASPHVSAALGSTTHVGGKRRLQLRWEIYNLLNQTQWSTIDNTLRYDATGTQVNAQFGKATAARNPRIMQGAIRFSF